MESKNVTKVVLTNEDNTKQVHVISKGESNATVIIPSSSRDLVSRQDDDKNAFSFMPVEDLKEYVRNKIDPNLNIDKPVIVKPLNYATNYSGGIELGAYRLPSLPKDRVITTEYQFSRSPIFTTLEATVYRTGKNLINLSPNDLIDIGIKGGDDQDYYLRVRVFCNSYSSKFSDVVKFRYAPSAYNTPKIYKLKLHNRDVKNTGTVIERTYRDNQPAIVREEIAKSRSVSSFETPVKSAGVQLPTVDYDNTNLFPANNGIVNYILHALGVFNVEWRTIKNIPSFACSYVELRNLMNADKKNFVSSGQADIDLFRFNCTYKSGKLSAQQHTHVLASNSFRTIVKNNRLIIDSNLYTESQQEFLDSNTDIDLRNILLKDVTVFRHDSTYLESGEVLTDGASDYIYFINLNKGYNPEYFKDFTLFNVKDPRLPLETSPIVNKFTHYERDSFCNQMVKAKLAVNHHIENINWTDEVSGTVGYPGEVNPDPDEIPVLPDNPSLDRPNEPQEDLNPNYDNYDPDTTPYTGRIDLYFSPSSSKCGDPGIPNIIEVEFREMTYNTVRTFEYSYEELQSELLMQLVPLELLPGYTYSVRFRFKNTVTNVTSDWSNVRRLEIPATKLFIIDLNLAGKSNGVLTSNPTIGITDIVSDYDFLDLVYKNPNGLDGVENHPYLTNLNKIRNGKMEYKFKIETTTGTPTTIIEKLFTKPIESISNYLYKGYLFTINTVSEGININPSTQYKLSCTIQAIEDNTLPLPSTFIYNKEESKKVQTSTMFQDVPTDNLDNPITNYRKCKYYGEVMVNNLMPDIKYRGYYTKGIRYEPNDEVIYLEEGNVEPSLYLCLGRHVAKLKYPDVNSNYFVKITDETFKKYYRSGLPTYSWLSDKIGLPLLCRNNVSGDGSIQNEIYCSDLLYNDGWIKVQNQINNVLYIAKKPFVSRLSYDEISKRFLNGHNSKTIRIGRNYYNVRLLEVNPNSVYVDKFVDYDTMSSWNCLGEDDLYKLLFDRSFYNTSIKDIGYNDNNNHMYIAGGIAETLYKDSSISVEYSELLPIQKSQSEDSYYYRPVLELVKNTYLPYNLCNENIPGNKIMEYDKHSDTGIYGILDSSELLTPKEIKDMFNLEMDITEDDIYYYKLYYHGLIMFIPNKPIGTNVKYSDLIDKGIMFGNKFKSGNVINGVRFGITVPDMNPNLHDPIDNIPHSNSVLVELLSRINNNKYGYGYNNYQFRIDRNELDLENVIFKNIEGKTEECNRYTIKEDTISKVPLEEKGSFLPIIVMEAYDFTSSLVYDDIDYGEPTVEYREVTYRPIQLVEKEVEKIVPVKKTTTYKEQVLVQVRKEELTGYVNYKSYSKLDTDAYGLVVAHMPKTELGGDMKILYGDDSLNITNVEGELRMKYGIGDNPRYKNISDYICKSLLANKVNPLIPEYAVISKTFESAAGCKAYIRSLYNETLSLMSLTNSAYQYPNTSLDRKYPLGMMLGTLSSKMFWYPVPLWYSLYNPKLSLEERLNLSPNIMLVEENGDIKIKNSFNTIKDINNVDYNIPLLSPFVEYKYFTDDGKNILKYYMEYSIRKKHPDMKQDVLEEEVLSFMKNNLFTIMGTDLNNLYCLPDSGIIANGYTSCTVAQFPLTYKLSKYFPGTTYESSLGKSLVDIFNPIPESNIWYEPGYVEIEKEKEYVELETRVFKEYIQVEGDPVTITIPIINYK